MEQLAKRQRVTKESTYHDIASFVREVSESLTSISENYRALLKVNKAVVLYMQSAKKQQDTSVDGIQTDLEQTRIEHN